MANEEHVERLKHSIEEWNAWRQEHPGIYPDLHSSDLRYADLRYADLRYANLRCTDLTSAILSHTDLSGAGLTDANLTTTDLSRAYLYCTDLSNTLLDDTNFSYARLIRASLNGAKLTRTDFWRTDLSNVDLGNADFTDVHFYHTIMAWLDLSGVKGLLTTIHSGPSSLDINSVTLPYDEPTRLHFLRGVGFTETQIEYLPSLLTPRPIQYQSVFICYSHQDEDIAQRLYIDLRKKDVLCWKASHDLRPGDYHHSRIDEAIHLHEKTLLLLSEHAVNSSWVKHEVQVALAREITQDCTVLFPLRLDEAVIHTSKDWAVRLRESRHIGDFTSWQEDAAYQEAFSRLLRDLRVSSVS